MQKISTLLFCLLFWVMLAAEPNKPLDEETWRDLTEDVDYVERNRESNFSWPNLNLNINTQLIEYILFTLIIGLLIYLLVRYIISLQNAGRPDADRLRVHVNNLDEAEENPMHADLERLIEKLIQAEDYRSATRAYYLLVLQRMNRAGLITWEKPKTNFDYVREVNKQPFHSDFKQVTFLFEHVWYGTKNQDAARFGQTQKSFQNVLNQLRHE